MAALAAKRQVNESGDVLTIVTPTYRLVVDVPVRGRTRVRSIERGEMLSPAGMAVAASQTANQRPSRWNMKWLTPRIARVVCPTCGPARAVEMRVPLPVMVAHRRASCSSGDCAIYRKRFGLSICPRRLGGCGCLLNLKWLIAGAHCPAGRW